ncbi:MAG: FAD-dependent oxidoreductase, partial [Acetobacteraceae bacterium]|nr:FAD-dependent oxidoreductase [Acetobacteraceae bacterium]
VEEVAGSEFDLPADLVVEALGFTPEDLPTLFAAPDLPVDGYGRMQVARPSMMTELPGVFAAGDIVRGASLVVWAAREGQDAAAAIGAWLDARAATTTDALEAEEAA